VTGGAGEFSLPNVDAGTYVMVVRLQGFADATRNVELLARQIVRADTELQIASASEKIEVTAVRPVIERERSTIDSSISGQDISKLALNFRATNNTSPSSSRRWRRACSRTRAARSRSPARCRS
jgi:hypothetical protein